MSPAIAGALIGAGLAAGVWLVLLGLPRSRGVSLDDRVAPYLGVDLPSRRRFAAAGGGAAAVLAALAAGSERWLSGLGSDPASVRARLARAGDPIAPEQFRAQQLACGFAGAGVAGLFALALVAGRGTGPVPAAVVTLLGGLVGVLGRDQLLSRAARRRTDTILAEFPAVAELFALAVGAGEGAAAALDRVVRSCSGALCEELGRALGESRTGTPLTEALQRTADRVGVPALSVFVDGVVVAMERGTPLADVLRAQAQDVRVAARRRLMEAGGRREIAMMVPVVFLVLPVTVVFAVYPGLAVLDLTL